MTAGKDAKVQINGTSGNWNEPDTNDISPAFSPDNLDATRHGDDAPRRERGLNDTSIDLTVYTDPSNTAFTDLQDSAIIGTDVDVEFAFDRNAGTPTVYAFTAKVSDFSPSNSVDGIETVSVTLENSDGGLVTTSSGFST